MSLYRVTFTHYAPKGNHTGVESIVSAPSEEALFDHINATAYGIWEDEDLDDDEEWSPDEPLSDADNARAASLGLTTTAEPWGGVTLSGPRGAMVRFHRGDHYRDVEDAYYGCVRRRWEAICGEYDEATLRLVMGDRFIVL